MTRAYPIEHIVGKGSEAVDALKAIHIRQSVALLEHAKSPTDRKQLSDRIGIPERTILDFANAADLMRIKGIGRDHVALLRAVEVYTVRDLRNRNAGNLFHAMASANVANAVVRFLPAESFVRRWIEQAKVLPLVITYK